MEIEGVLIMWRRSVEKHNNGDSKSVLASKIYGEDFLMEKIDCVGHIQNTIGKRLLNLKATYKEKPADGKILGGRERLTEAVIKQASSCRARGCHRCGQKHHTTICTLPQQSSTKAMGNSLLKKGMSGTHHAFCAIHPTLHASVNGEKVRIMIYTGASSSYIYSDLIALFDLKPARREKHPLNRCMAL